MAPCPPNDLRPIPVQGLPDLCPSVRLSGLELADDLLGCVPDAFHGEVPGSAWPDEDSHSL